MKVSATLKGTLDSLGRKTVYIRKAEGSKRKFFATNIRIEPKNWDKKVINHPKAKQYNEQIKNLILNYEEKGIPSNNNFYKYAISLLSKWEQSKKSSTLIQLKSKLDKFTSFYSGDIQKISPDVLQSYVDYCYSLGNGTNTVWASLKAVRVFIKEAKKQRIITEDPFEIFDMPKYRDPEKIYLTKAQVKSIEKFLKTCHTDYRIATAWFLISCYTGLRYGDQRAFNKSKIKDGRLIVYTSKTGKVVSIKMNPKLKELFSIVGYKPIPYTNEHYNRLLKLIATTCEIPEKVSVHTARHTFGTLCASAGISQEVTAALMGHSSIRTTQIYYNITGTRIDTEFDKIFVV